MTADDPETWRERRTAGAQARAEAMARAKAAESERARELLRAFVSEALARGIAPTPLTATSYSGRGGYRTSSTGWYIRRNRSLAVGTDAEFYILTVPGGLRARLTGVQLTPSDPPLVVGAGGRDGETISLGDLLRQRLDAGDDWE